MADEGGQGELRRRSDFRALAMPLKKKSISVTFVVRIIYIELYKFPAPQNLKEKILH
jgi:hypothetical protein